MCRSRTTRLRSQHSTVRILRQLVPGHAITDAVAAPAHDAPAPSAGRRTPLEVCKARRGFSRGVRCQSSTG
jgi:hypothetical protein